MGLHQVLFVLAAVCFALATVGVGGRVNLIALGLLAWLLTQVV